MFVDKKDNRCKCLTGYVFADDGLNCRIGCKNGYKYNIYTKKC